MASIQGVYLALFGRPADPLGLSFFNQATNNGANLTAIGDLASTAEYQTRFSGQTNTQIITTIYRSLFNRDPDLAGLTFFANALANKTLSINNIAIAIFDGAQGSDVTIRDLKVAAANAFTAQIDTVAEINGYSGTAAANSGVAFIAGVTTTAPTAEQVSAAVATATSLGGAVGQTFTLTSSVDNLTGTSANDIFVAGEQAGNVTLSAGDQINGGNGTDTLNIFAGAANFGSATISGIEVVNINQNAGLDVSANADVKEVWQIGGSGQTSTATVAQTIGFANAAGGGAAVATFTNVAGSADSATIAVRDAGKTTAYTSVTVAGIETLTVNAAGSNKLGTLTAVDAAKLVITGAGSVTAALSNNAAYKTIDGSTSTGALSIDASAANVANQTLDIKTGTGGDTYTTLFANLTKDDKIDLGAGTDTLAFADATNLSTSANVALLGGVANVETLRVNGTAAFTVDADLVSQALFNHSSTGAFTGTNFASADKLIVGAVDIANSTVAMKLGQNTFNVDLAGSSTAASLATGITVTGASTVNVASAGTAGVADNQLALTTDSNGTVKVSGAQNLTLTTALNGGTTGLSIDAATFTGKLTVTGTGQGDIIVGGTGADIITGGDGTDTLTGGAGADRFAFATGDNAGANGAAVADIITDFVAGTDKLQFTGVTDVVSGQQAAVQAAVTALAAGATDAQIATAMANANTTDLGVSFAVYNGNTYVYFETTGATATHVEADNVFVKLSGVTTLPTFAADVIA